MEIRALGEAVAFTTKDGSTIRELVGPGLAANQTLAEATLAPGRTTERHRHARTEEIYFLLEGAAEMELDGERRAVHAGDAILIPPGARHSITAGPAGVRFLCCCAPGYTHEDTLLDRG